MSDSPNLPPAGIRVITRFSPFAFLLYLAKTVLHLDGGQAVERPWGETAIPVQPGRHEVRCYCRWLFWRAFGDASIVVDVPPGQLFNLVWRPPWLPLQAGQWTVLGIQPLTGPVPVAATIEAQAPTAAAEEPAEQAASQEASAEAPPVPKNVEPVSDEASQPTRVEPQPNPQPQVETTPAEAGARLQAATQVQPVAAAELVTAHAEPLGRNEQQPQVTAPSRPLPVAGWYPDPARRHQYRYWDGKEWAPHVADNGVMAADPL